VNVFEFRLAKYYVSLLHFRGCYAARADEVAMARQLFVQIVLGVFVLRGD